jgi:uncharacterized Zn-finger protein
MPARVCVNYLQGSGHVPVASPYFPNPMEYEEEEGDFGAQLKQEIPDDPNKSLQSFSPKMYECSYDGCDASFASLANKKRHEKNHCGDRPYACEFGCGKSFSRKYDMKVHLRVHTKEKPYQCTIDSCGKRFSRNSSLREHERSIHHINQSRRRSTSSDDSDYSPSFSLAGSYSNPSLCKREFLDKIPQFARRSNSIEVTDPATKAEIASLVQRYQDARTRSASFSLDQILTPSTSKMISDPPAIEPSTEYSTREYCMEHEETASCTPWVLPLTNQLIL